MEGRSETSRTLEPKGPESSGRGARVLARQHEDRRVVRAHARGEGAHDPRGALRHERELLTLPLHVGELADVQNLEKHGERHSSILCRVQDIFLRNIVFDTL